MGMIESMKLMNEVTSQFDGEINEILVEDGCLSNTDDTVPAEPLRLRLLFCPIKEAILDVLTYQE